MSTRGLYGFRFNSKDKVAYNHCDSYPEGLGREVIDFCVNHSIEEMQELYQKITLVMEDVDKPTPQQIKWAKDNNLFNGDVSSRSETDWYCLLRGIQGDLARTFRIAKDTGMMCMIDYHDFILDSLFCEYAYIINLDTGMLEFWEGFQKKPQNGNRYGEVPNDDGYFPCKHVADYPLENIDADVTLKDMIAKTKEGGNL